MSHETITDSGGHVVARILTNGDRKTLLDGSTGKVLGHYANGTTLKNTGKPISRGDTLMRLIPVKK